MANTQYVVDYKNPLAKGLELYADFKNGYFSDHFDVVNRNASTESRSKNNGLNVVGEIGDNDQYQSKKQYKTIKHSDVNGQAIFLKINFKNDNVCLWFFGFFIKFENNTVDIGFYSDDSFIQMMELYKFNATKNTIYDIGIYIYNVADQSNVGVTVFFSDFDYTSKKYSTGLNIINTIDYIVLSNDFIDCFSDYILFDFLFFEHCTLNQFDILKNGGTKQILKPVLTVQKQVYLAFIFPFLKLNIIDETAEPVADAVAVLVDNETQSVLTDDVLMSDEQGNIIAPLPPSYYPDAVLSVGKYGYDLLSIDKNLDGDDVNESVTLSVNNQVVLSHDDACLVDPVLIDLIDVPLNSLDFSKSSNSMFIPILLKK